MCMSQMLTRHLAREDPQGLVERERKRAREEQQHGGGRPRSKGEHGAAAAATPKEPATQRCAQYVLAVNARL